jgi:hypothetical protein
MTRRTLHPRTFDLLPLRRVLLAARRSAPALAPSPGADERQARLLIDRMKGAPALKNLFAGIAVESFRPAARAVLGEMAESHA